MYPNTLLTLPLLIALASPVLAEEDKALLAKCDFNKNGTIDTAEMYGITTRAAFRTADPKIREAVSKEVNCKVGYELAKGKEELAKGKEELAKINKENDQLIEILAMLDAREAKTYLRDEIQKAENRLATAKANGDQRSVKSIEYRLNTLRGRQQKLQLQ